eukprot:TRINITY_DN1154_c0_g1_i4.p1 TRINITY_DN1154_c0_g1~~TRINITY_DN1154_c0_g1_i4.p1  ORF type:complete len:138 (-),score=18.95 TRINITY_DN1154_c0_g1_i4:158-571(-)
MASGVAVDDNVVAQYQALKLGHQFRYITARLSDDLREIVLDKTSTDNDYSNFVSELPSNDCRYAVYNFEYTAEDGGSRHKIIFFLWAPDTAKVKAKMIYTSSKDSIRKKLVGIGTEVQATDRSEIAHSAVLEKVLRK